MPSTYKKLSIVIPVYNESATIRDIVKLVLDIPLPAGLDREIVIVDDGSTDGTREILASFDDPRIHIHLKKRNEGKGSAMKVGFENVSGDLVIVQDADLEYDPKEYPKLLKPILDGRADVVYGSRYLTSHEHRVLYYYHTVGNHMLTILSNLVTNLNLTDVATCYKAFRREILDKISLEEKGFAFDPEITAKLSKMKARIFEVSISYYGRTYEEGKKINLRHVPPYLWAILKYNLFRR